MKSLTKFLGVGIVSLFLLSSCGGGNPVKDYNYTVGTSYNAISGAFTTMLKGLTEEINKDAMDYARFSQFISDGISEISPELGLLKNATPPQGEGVKEVSDTVQVFVTEYEAMIKVFEELKAASDAKNAEKVQEVNQRLLPHFQKIDELGGKLIEAQKNMLIKNNLAKPEDFSE